MICGEVTVSTAEVEAINPGNSSTVRPPLPNDYCNKMCF